MFTKSIAITGATGFVGRFLVEYFLNKGYKVYAFRKEEGFKTKSEVEKYITWDITKGPLNKQIEVEAVIHCAGLVTHWGSYQKMFLVNVLGTKNVVKSFPKAKFIYISTASVYDPFQPKIKISENIQKPKKYLNAYQQTKWEAEQQVIQNSDNYIIFRPHAIYGPNDTTLLPRILRAKKTFIKRFLIIGDGQNVISLTYVGNLAKGIELAITSPVKNEIFNISDQKDASTKDILNRLKEVLQIKEKNLFVPKKLVWIIGLLIELFYRFFKIKKEPLITRYTVSQMSDFYTLDISKIQNKLNYKTEDNYINKFLESYGSKNNSN